MRSLCTRWLCEMSIDTMSLCPKKEAMKSGERPLVLLALMKSTSLDSRCVTHSVAPSRHATKRHGAPSVLILMLLALSSCLTISWWPRWHAWISGDSLSRDDRFASALCSSSFSTTATWPFSTALKSAVVPSSVVLSISMPWRSSSSQMRP